MSKKTVLVVDDDTTFLDIYKMIMDEMDPQTYTLIATKGQMALDIMEKQKIDLILTDIRMPEIGGIELIRKIKEQYGEQRPKIIAISSYDSSYPGDNIKTAQDEGVDGILSKPLDAAMIMKAIHRTLNI